MGKPEFGRKVTCTVCAVRFFDLTRTPAVCPKCGVEQPRIKPRVAPAARASTVRWSGRQPPMVLPAAVPEPTLLETDPLEEVDEDDTEAADLPDDDDDEDDAPKAPPEG